MYTPDSNEARHMISARGALLDPCLPNALNTLSHPTPSRSSRQVRKCVVRWGVVFAVNYAHTIYMSVVGMCV